MSTLTWTDALALNQPHIDATHREFVALLAAVEAALDADLPTLGGALDDFIAHTEAHFAQEDAWMQRVGFGEGHCHGREHASVLELAHEVRRRLRAQGEARLVRSLVAALAEWFPMHAGSLDAGLAQVMLARGFDPDTGAMLKPPGEDQGTDAACEHLAEG